MSFKKSYPTICIWIIVVLYLASMISMLIYIPIYIEKKDQRLRAEIGESVRNAFGNRNSYVDIAYSNEPVEYERGSLPKKPSSSYPNLLKEWKEDYGNLYKIYDINWKGNREKPWEHQDGWNLMEIHYDWEGVYASWYFPYKVGYIKQDYSWGYDYAPSVPNAVNAAFEFFTENSESHFYDSFERGSIDRIFSEIESNQYYWLERDSVPRRWHTGTPIIPDLKGSWMHPRVPVEATYMYNGYYKVFVAYTQYSTWTIKKWAWGPDVHEKNELMKKWSIGLTIGAIILLLPFIIVNIKRKQKSKESLYNKLLRLCNPSSFVKNFDKNRMDAANDIYQRLISIQNKNDDELLYPLADEASERLSIQLIDPMVIDSLKEQLNPKNFMTPYNSEKIARANELMEKLISSELKYKEFLEIKKHTSELYK